MADAFIISTFNLFCHVPLGKLTCQTQLSKNGRSYEFEEYVGVIRRATEMGVPPAAINTLLVSLWLTGVDRWM